MAIKGNWSENWNHYDVRDIQKNEVVMPNVRLQSNAGWYVGAIEFYDYNEMDFYSRDTDYYPNEEMLKEEYPNSISTAEAFDKIKHDKLYKRKMERKLGH